MAGIQIPYFVVVLVAILLIVLVCTAMQEAQFTLRPSTEASLIISKHKSHGILLRLFSVRGY